MTWKIGDKVRLTGTAWPDYEGTNFRRGSEHVITGVIKGEVQLSGDPYCWHNLPDWEIELVERKEETMSIDISEVNVGDRVRLTRENGDEATFKVLRKSMGYLYTDHNTYEVRGKDTLEIVERAFKLVPGLYENTTSKSRVVVTVDGSTYFTSVNGAWAATPNDLEYPGSQTYEAVRETRSWRRKITF